MNLQKFKNENIKVYTYDFKQQPYSQQWENEQGFIENLSIIDLLFNSLENANKYIINNGSISRAI